MIGLVAVTAAGHKAAERLAAAWPDARRYDGLVSKALPRAFKECDAVVCFLAVGATVRLIAPLLTGKDQDPGVVCVDEALRYAVPVLGAHAGGGNELARRIAQTLGAEPVITTASDAAGAAALDEFGADLGFTVEPGSDLAAVGTAILSGERVTFSADQDWPLPPLPPNVVRTDRPEPGVPAVVVTDLKIDMAERAAVYRPPSLIVGVGTSRGAPAAEIGDLIDGTLVELGVSPRSVRYIATADVKADEHGLQAAAAERGWRVVTFPASRLAAVPVPNPSEVVRRAVGTPSVAEAAALIHPEATLLAAKRASAHATVAVARCRPRGRLAVIGIGPGARDLMTPRAVAELRRAAVVAGLDSYLEDLAIAQIFGAATERLGDRRLLGVQVLIYRRADDHHQVLRRGHHCGVGRGLEPPGAERPVQDLIRARLGERHPARVHPADRGLAHVIDTHPGAPVGERERQWQAHVPAAPDDNHISVDLIRQLRHRTYLRLIMQASGGHRVGASVTSLALYLTAMPIAPRALLSPCRRPPTCPSCGLLTGISGFRYGGLRIFTGGRASLTVGSRRGSKHGGVSWPGPPFTRNAACLVKSTYRPARGPRSRSCRTARNSPSRPALPPLSAARPARGRLARWRHGRTAPPWPA